MHSSVNDQPWIMIWDFNKVKRQNERSDPSSVDSSAADDFFNVKRILICRFEL